MVDTVPAAVEIPAAAAVQKDGLIGFIERRPETAFGWFLALHFAVWTALPALLYANLPLDLIEAVTYGREWPLGSDKLPPLPWWLVEIMYRSFGSDAAYYALAQAVVVIAFALVFVTARPLVGATGALVAVLIVDGMHYFQYTAVKFNHDVIQLPFWALAGYSFHAALTRGRTGHWALLGIAFGGALWAKYFVVVLAAPYALFLLFDPKARRALATPGPWLTTGLALLIALPHLLWLFQNDFIPFHYAEHRAAPVRGWFDHVVHPAFFAASQLFFLLPTFFIAGALLWRQKRHGEIAADAFDRRIVTVLAFGPAIATIALGVASGRGAIAMWGYPLWLFLGLWIVMTLRPLLDRAQIARVGAAWAAVFTLFALVFLVNYTVLPRFDHRYYAEFYPGDKLGQILTAALPRRDRKAAALCHRLDVGRRQSRPLFAGPAACADRRRTGARAVDRSCRSAQGWRGRGVDAERSESVAAAIRGRRARRRSRRAVRSADAPRRWRRPCRLGDREAADITPDLQSGTGLRHRFDDPAHLVENLADLRLADDQRRRQRDGVAGDADQHLLVGKARSIA